MTRGGGGLLFSATMIFASVSVTHAHSQTLDSAAREALATFGEGVVVATSGDATISNAVDWAGLEPGTSTFNIVSGGNSGTSIERTVKPKTGEAGTYVVTLGKAFASTLVVEKGGVFLTTEVNTTTSSLSTFNLPEPVLLNEKSMTRTIRVELHEVDEPAVVTHSGSLECTYEVLGTFKVKAPAGTFDAIGVRVNYEGSVGSANVVDANYVFFAKDVGPVAMRFRSHISALLVYNKKLKESLLLAKK